MRTPSYFLVRKFARLIAMFILGMITGSVIMMYIYSASMDELMLENRYLVTSNTKLEDQVEDLQEDLEKLDEQNQQVPRIKEIEINILKQDDDQGDDIDGYVETEISDRLYNDLRDLVNTPLEDMAGTQVAVRNLIHGKSYEINEQEIEVKFESMVIHTTLTVQVSLHKQG